MSPGWVWLVVVFALGACAQECGNACDLHVTACSNIDYPLYYTNASDVQAAEDIAIQAFAQTKILPQKCQDLLATFICNVLHPSCGSSTSAPKPILPCVQICHDLISSCGDPELIKLFAPDPLKPYVDCSNGSLYQLDSSEQCSQLNNSVPLCHKTSLTWPGRCVPYQPELAPRTGVFCEPFVSRMVYIPSDNVTKAFSDLDNYSGSTYTRLHTSEGIIPLNCYKYLLAVLCPVIFPSCQYQYIAEFNQTVVVGHTICHDLCEAATAECQDFLTYADVPYFHPSCDKDTLQNVYTGPIYNLTIDKQCDVNGSSCHNVTVPVTCNGKVFPDDAYANFTLPEVTCTAETGKKKNPGPNDPLCGLKCPDASYSDEEWRRLVILTQAGSGISLACMAFLICTYLLKTDKRKFPATTHLHEFVATSMFSITFLIGGSSPEKNVWCYDEGTYATQSNNTTCAVQGFFFIFFGLALAAWCAVIAFTMFYSIVIRNRKDTLVHLQKLNKWFLVFGWGIPLAFAVAALASQKIGYGPPMAWCFIRFEGHGYGSVFSSDYPLFYIPAGILFLLILVMFWVTIAAILNVYRTRAKSSENTVFIQAQIRVLIFIFVIFAICFTIFEWRFQIEGRSRKLDLAKVGLQWTYCRIKVKLGLTDADYTLCPGEHNPARVDYGHTVFESFLLSGIGLLIFIAFGSDPGIYHHWAKILRLLFAREWEKLKAFVVVGTDPFTTLASSSSFQRSHRSNSTPGNSDISLDRSIDRSLDSALDRSGSSIPLQPLNHDTAV